MFLQRSSIGVRSRLGVGRSFLTGSPPSSSGPIVKLLTPFLLSLCLVLLAGWVPHYLLWPWWPDHDTNAAIALAWSRGLLPYRDITAFTFPGQIYLFSLLHALGGLGQTWPFMALDASLVLLLCLALHGWSLHRCRSLVPGSLASLALLSYLLSLNFSLAAQRDGQAAILAVLGLLALTTLPTRFARLAAGVALGLSLCFRPHVLLFSPAMILGVWLAARQNGERTARALLAWLTPFLATALLVFLPILWLGLGPDLLLGIRLASYGGTYSQATIGSVLAALARQAFDLRYLSIPVTLGLALLSHEVPSRLRRDVAVWVAAAVGVSLYKPAHPVAHDYLAHAAWILWAPMLGMLAILVLSSTRLAGWPRAAALILLSGMALPGKPPFFNLQASLQAVQGLLQNGHPADAQSPPGYVHHMSRYQIELPDWQDYHALLTYLRSTNPRTPVANALKYQLPVNGAVGRISPFRNESGLLWLTQVGRPEDLFIRELLADPETLVVWSPDLDGPDPGFTFPRLESAIRSHFHRVEKFGGLEVWGRNRSAQSLSPE